MHRAMLNYTACFALSLSMTYAMGPEMIGKPAPAFTLKTVDGRSSLSLADLRGQVVIIDFWATLGEDPHLVRSLGQWNR